jgi:hypothetical protein
MSPITTTRARAENPEERARLLADLGHRHILILRNHGLLIVGTSIAVAFVATYRMERACAMHLAFQQSGAAFYPINDEAVTAAYNRPVGGNTEPAKVEWPALLRKFDRIDPSYKQQPGAIPPLLSAQSVGKGGKLSSLKNIQGGEDGSLSH